MADLDVLLTTPTQNIEVAMEQLPATLEVLLETSPSGGGGGTTYPSISDDGFEVFITPAESISLQSAGVNFNFGERASITSNRGAATVGIGDTSGAGNSTSVVIDDIASTISLTGTVSVNGSPLDKSTVGLSNVDNTSDANKPVSTAQTTAIAAKEPTITAGTTSQYWRGDKTFQTLDKTAVGLANVDNTSDANKPVSTAQSTALSGKINSRVIASVATNTAAGATANTDYVYFVSGTTTLTLPTAVANVNRYTVKNTGSATVTIATTSAQTIDGSTGITLTATPANKSVDLVSDGANWQVI